MVFLNIKSANIQALVCITYLKMAFLSIKKASKKQGILYTIQIQQNSQCWILKHLQNYFEKTFLGAPGWLTQLGF